MTRIVTPVLTRERPAGRLQSRLPLPERLVNVIPSGSRRPSAFTSGQVKRRPKIP